MTGEVKSYAPRHYGFITADGDDYRFSHKDWSLRLPPTPGFKVEFDAYKTDKGLRATNIRNSQ